VPFHVCLPVAFFSNRGTRGSIIGTQLLKTISKVSHCCATVGHQCILVQERPNVIVWKRCTRVTWHYISAWMTQDARLVYLMWREEHLWNVGVLQRVQLSGFVLSGDKLILHRFPVNISEADMASPCLDLPHHFTHSTPTVVTSVSLPPWKAPTVPGPTLSTPAMAANGLFWLKSGTLRLTMKMMGDWRQNITVFVQTICNNITITPLKYW
jgi:hypothetical protein